MRSGSRRITTHISLSREAAGDIGQRVRGFAESFANLLESFMQEGDL
jgi:hypothetical protein